MYNLRHIIFAFFFATSIDGASVLQSRGPTCSDIIIPVSIHAENLAIVITFSATDLETLVNTLGSSLFNLGTNIINKTYNIAATYVSPLAHKSSTKPDQMNP